MKDSIFHRFLARAWPDPTCSQPPPLSCLGLSLLYTSNLSHPAHWATTTRGGGWWEENSSQRLQKGKDNYIFWSWSPGDRASLLGHSTNPEIDHVKIFFFSKTYEVCASARTSSHCSHSSASTVSPSHPAWQECAHRARLTPAADAHRGAVPTAAPQQQ
jgi:hypothetical protein